MKRVVFLSSLFLLISLLYYCTQEEKKPAVPAAVKEHVAARFDLLQQVAEEELLQTATNGEPEEVLAAFLRTRRAYKQIEWFTEYYAPTASKELNGPPLPEFELEETRVFEPSGLQVIEELVYPELAEENRGELVNQVKAFLSTFKRTRLILEESVLTEAHILDACKQEVFRTMILGISGFDTPLVQTGVQEAAVALASVQEVLAHFGENTALQDLLGSAVAYAQQGQDFNGFDRMQFITQHANPVTQAITKWQQELNIAPLETALAVNPTAGTLFEEDALNQDYFVGNLEARTSPEKVSLGKDLFHNPIVSGGTRTCATCHQPALAFTDGLPKSAALHPGRFVTRNAPTLLYAGLQHAQFYDMRSPTLENQAMDVIANKDEMHGSVEAAAIRLNQQPAYVSAFQKAFPTMEKAIKPRYVMMALATYIRSLSPFKSRFDHYMRGDTAKMTAEEIKGFNLFMGKAKCGTCHFMPLFNGTAGPAFSSTEGEVLGVLESPNNSKPVIDPDEGRYRHNQLAGLKFAFKTPTLRNVSQTAPYMHNGSYKTLEQVMDFYNRGGGAGLGLDLEHQTLPSDPLDLSPEEQKAIIAFLGTLTDL
ncbi:cytochrome c peroxidase [Rufibacter psychrotolerans]|uniref:cytochrome c peroxidase n=1 Tax=Rufibacter psychrotolerans TaxID=2812556 RepID=UPI0019684C61|nr:cytochrome c peroxidase [Rufibacter sp. SYSU D00308]